MHFTISFLELFFLALVIVSPLLFFLSVIVITLGLIVTKIEKWNIFDGLYWALITATTVGYGDMRPSTKIAKAISTIIALIGIMFTGLIVAITVYAATASISKHIDIDVVKQFEEALN